MSLNIANIVEFYIEFKLNINLSRQNSNTILKFFPN